MNEVSEQKVETAVIDLLGSNIVASLTVAAIIGTASGFGWLVRRVFTNQKQVEMLQKALHVRDDQRKEDREDMKEIKGDVKDLTLSVHSFIAKQDAKDELSDKK